MPLLYNEVVLLVSPYFILHLCKIQVITLLKSSSKIEPSLSSLLEECEFLNTSYIDTRYPVYWSTNYTKEKALKAKESVKKIGETINELLKKAGYV